jgi:hypothetical protein
VNVIIQINGREAIPVRALPLLAEWGTMHPQKIAGALGRVTDDDCRPLFENLHDMNAFYVEDGSVNPVAAYHWRDHIYRNLQALSDTIKHSEITHETGHSEWRVRALGVLPKDAFVWRDEYELIYDRTYGIGSRTRESGDAHTPPVLSKGKPPVELNFNPLVEDEMKPLVQAALDAIGRAKNDVAVNSGEQQSSEVKAPQRVEVLPLMPAVGPTSDWPAPLPAAPNWKMLIQAEATAYCLRLRKAGANPTKNSILEPMVKWCRDNNVKTDGGIYPRDGYLRTHVLGGKHWDVPN